MRRRRGGEDRRERERERERGRDWNGKQGARVRGKKEDESEK